MEEIGILRTTLIENDVEKIRNIETNCLEKINSYIGKVKYEVKNIKRDRFVEGFISETIKTVIFNDNPRRDQMVVAGR